MFFLIIYTSVLLIISHIVSKQNIFSPATLTSALWLVCITLFYTLNHNLYPITQKFTQNITIWITTIWISSLSIQSFKFNKKTNLDASEFIRDIFLLISTICFPFLFFWVQDALAVGETNNWAQNLRLAAIGKSELGDDIYGGLSIIIWQITYTVELIHFNKKKFWRTILPAIYILSFSFFTMSKTGFLTFFSATVTILFLKNRISTTKICAGIFVFIIGLLILQSIRENTNFESSSSQTRFISLYLLSPISAFETLTPSSSVHPGENVFRIIFAIKYKLGLSNIEPIEPILEFVKVPMYTNTYTIMYPFYKDFGTSGVLVFGLILGTFWGYLFKKSIVGNTYCTIIFAYISHMILMQFAGDFTFTNLTGLIKFMLIAALLFLPTKKLNTNL